MPQSASLTANSGVERTLLEMADRLVDLSGRNRLISYKERRVSTVSLTDIDPAWLYDDDARARGFEFWFADASEAAPEYETQLDLARARVRRGERVLITSDQDGSALRKRLRTLAKTAREYQEERSLHVLYLGVGFLEWTDDNSVKPETRRSPLVLIPVNLVRGSVREDFRLEFVDDEPVINPALTIALERQIKLPADFGWEDDKALIEELEDIERFASGQGWRVTREVRLDAFTFHKLAMYKDLQANSARVLESELGRLVTTGKFEASSSYAAAKDIEVSASEFDRLAPLELGTIRDCDSSQLECVIRARQGQSFVIQGPPGTGKSQTISNIIADSLQHGKTVLFVSEKAAALDVVYKRLAERGLSDFVLDLHSDKIKRKELVENLDSRMQHQPEVIAGRAFDSQSYTGARQRIVDVAAALDSPLDELHGRTPFDIHGLLARLADVPVVPGFPDRSISADELERLHTSFERIGSRLSDARRAAQYWNGYSGSGSDAAVAELRSLLEQLAKASAARGELIARVNDEAGLAAGTYGNDLTEVARVLECATAIPDEVDESWLAREDNVIVVNALEDARRAFEALSTAARACGGNLPGDDNSPLPLEQADSIANACEELDACRMTSRGEREVVREVSPVVDLLGRALAALGEHTRDATALLELFGIDSADSDLGMAERLASISTLLFDEPARIERLWLHELPRARAQRLLDEYGPAIKEAQRLRAGINSIWREAISDIDSAAYLERLKKADGAITARLLGPYRRDMKTLRDLTRSGAITRGDAIQAMWDLIRIKQLEEEIDASADALAEAFGWAWAHSATDLAAVEGGLSCAGAIHGLLGDLTEPAGDAIVRILAAAAEERLEPSRRVQHANRSRDALGATLAQVFEWFEPPATLDRESSSDVATWLQGLTTRTAAVRSARDDWEAAGGDASLPAVEYPRLRDNLRVVEQRRNEIAIHEANWSRALGKSYHGGVTDWTQLRRAIEWLSELRSLVGRGPIPRALTARLVAGETDQLAQLAKAARSAEGQFLSARARVQSLYDVTAYLPAHGTSSTLRELAGDAARNDEVAGALATELTTKIGYLEIWSLHRDRHQSLGEDRMAGFLDKIITDDTIDNGIERVFERAFWSRQLDRAYDRLPALKGFDPQEHASIVTRFRELDAALIHEMPRHVARAIAERAPSTSILDGTEQHLLHNQARARRKTMSVRKLLSSLPTLLPRLKPCLMMSPLTVSTFLSPETAFDVVIFDEASQVKPEDGINCVYRGRQLIVAGDEKQLPPSSFFSTADGVDGDGTDDDDATVGAGDLESILAVCGGAMPSIMLNWHYRSQDETLIAYSNFNFYGNRLVTFPAASFDDDRIGVRFHKVAGTYDRGGSSTNDVEARAVAERVVEVLSKSDGGSAIPSVGVIALSSAQERRIEEHLWDLRKTRPELDAHFGDDRLESVFIKNLENVQGDERDVILLSVCYGPGPDGAVHTNFGPINREGGERRLNVAVTRARQRMELFASMSHGDIKRAEGEKSGVRLLRQYLEYAERGPEALDQAVRVGFGDFDSPFEEAVAHELRSKGWDIHPQVGVQGYRIDLGIVDPDRPGRYLAGVECDGAMYHSAPTARERDRLRADVLEHQGWNLFRIWSTDWFRHRQSEIDRIVAGLEELRRGGPKKNDRRT